MKELHNIKSKLEKHLSGFVNLQLNDDLLYRIKESVLRVFQSTLQEEYYDFKEIKFDLKKDLSINSVKIEPKNLFTTLLFNGIFIRPDLLIGRSEYTVPDGGLTYGYDEVNGAYRYSSHVRFKQYKMSDLLDKK